MRCATYKSSWGSVNSGNLSSSRRISLINAVNSWSTSIIKPLFELVPGIDGVKPWCALWALNKPEINPTLLTYNCMNDDNYAVCIDLIKTGCTDIIMAESCPLQIFVMTTTIVRIITMIQQVTLPRRSMMPVSHCTCTKI